MTAVALTALFVAVCILVHCAIRDARRAGYDDGLTTGRACGYAAGWEDGVRAAEREFIAGIVAAAERDESEQMAVRTIRRALRVHGGDGVAIG